MMLYLTSDNIHYVNCNDGISQGNSQVWGDPPWDSGGRGVGDNRTNHVRISLIRQNS